MMRSSHCSSGAAIPEAVKVMGESDKTVSEGLAKMVTAVAVPFSAIQLDVLPVSPKLINVRSL